MAEKDDKGIDNNPTPENGHDGFKNLVDELPLGLLTCDREGNIVAINDFLLEILGSPSPDATKNINMLTFPALVEAGISGVIEETLTKGNNASIETPYLSAWSKELFLSFKAFPRKDVNGEICGCYAIIEDLTIKKDISIEIGEDRIKDELIEKISDRFINSAFRHIDRNISITLKDLGAFIDADRVVIFSSLEDSDHIIKTHEWHRKGIVSKIAFNDVWITKELVFKKVTDLQIVNIPDVNKLPEGNEHVKKALQKLGIGSVAMIPLSRNGIFKGFMGVYSKKKPLNWNHRQLYVLKMAGDIITNIIERKKAEELILEKEKEFEDVVNSLNAITWKATFDKEGNLLTSYISNTVDKVLGIPSGTIGSDWELFFAHIHPDDLPKVQDAFKRSFTQLDTAIDQDYRFILDNGDTIWFNSIGSSKLQHDGTFLTYGTSVNITERKEMENKLKESEERFKALHNASFGGISIHDRGLIIDCNLGLSEMTGYSQAELIGMDGLLLIAENHRDMVMSNILAGYEKPYEAMGRRKDGSEYPIRLEARNIPYKGKQVRVVEFRDITDQKNAEKEVREKEEIMRLLIENAPVSLIMLDNDLRHIAVSHRFLDEYPPGCQNIIGLHHYDVYPYLTEEIREGHQKGLRGEIVRDDESVIKMPDGKLRWTLWEVRPWRKADGTIGGIIIFSENISDKKQAQDELREREAILSEVGRIAKIGGWEVDLMSGEVSWTPEVSKIHDLDHDNTVTIKRGINYYVPESRKIIERALNDTIENAEPYDLELEIVSEKGRHKWVRTSARPKIENGKVVKIIGSFQDITERKNAENKIRENEEMLRLFIDHAPVALAMFDCKMQYIAASHRWLTDYYLGDIDIVGRSHYDIFPEISDEWKDMHRRCMKGEIIPVEETRFDRIDGRVQWVRGEVRPWRKANGNIGGIVLLSEDITERKKIEEAKRRSETNYRILFDRSNDAILVHDLKGKIVDVNEKACEMFGYSKYELKQRSIFDIIAPDERDLVHKMMIGPLPEHSRSERKIIRPDGTILTLDLNSSLLKMQEKLVQVVGRDITDRVKAAEAMLNAKIEAETASRTKSDFLANMSHELRTPLNSIIGFSDAMIDGIGGKLGSQQEHYLEHISESGHHLLSLINDILDISKVEAGKMELNFDMIDISLVVNDIVKTTQTLTSNKNITVDVDLPGELPKVKADRAKVKQILYNLIGNAIKFTPDNGRITILAGMKDNNLQISIIDTGIGISPKDQNKLFKPFSQIDSSICRKYAGTGLGLALVKELVELHGGRVWLESKPGKGSNFTFELPVDNKNTSTSKYRTF